MGPARSRGEANTEYVILLMFIMICAVVGLFTSYSHTIQKIQLEKGLCIDCTEKEKQALKAQTAPPPPPPPPTSAPPAPTTMSDQQSWWASFRSFLAWW